MRLDELKSIAPIEFLQIVGTILIAGCLIAVFAKPSRRWIANIKIFLWGTVKLISYIVWFPVKVLGWTILGIGWLAVLCFTNGDIDLFRNRWNYFFDWDYYVWLWVKSFYTSDSVRCGIYKE